VRKIWRNPLGTDGYIAVAGPHDEQRRAEAEIEWDAGPEPRNRRTAVTL